MYSENQVFRQAAPPMVNKIDGRARILRPQRQPSQYGMEHVVKASPSQVTMISSTSAPSLTAMKVLQPKPAQPSPATPSSHPDQKNVATVSETVFAERAQTLLRRLRSKMKDLTADVDRAIKTKNREDKEKVVLSCDDMKRAYGDLDKWSKMKVRRSPQYQSLAEAYQKFEQYSEQSPEAKKAFESYPQTISTQSQIDRNIVQFFENFRLVYLAKSQKPSALAIPPIFDKLKQCQEGNQMIVSCLEVLEKKLGKDILPWKYVQVEDMIFDKSCLVYEVLYAEKKPHKEFVPMMKSVLVIKFGELVDLTIGTPEEELYDEESLLPSKYTWYQKITKSAKSQLLTSPIAIFSTASNFVLCNNHLQNYVNCSMMPCSFCKRFLSRFEPPCQLTRDSPPQVCHDSCFKYNL